jgi:PhnB protein
MANVKPIPEGNHTITPSLVVKNGKKAIEFYKIAFGAKELGTMLGPDGQKVMHAELQIGDSKIYLGDEAPEMGAVSPQTLGGSPVSLNIYTEDCDAMFRRALAAGATVKMPLEDMFWGDRYGKLADPFGHTWGIATHKEDVSPEEMDKRAKEWMAAAAKK